MCVLPPECRSKHAPSEEIAIVHSRTHQTGRDQPIHWARTYDLATGLFWRRRRLRAMFAADLELRAGERVLDVGCGSGRLAMVFAARVAPTGSVDGIDAAAEMINLATSRARKHNLSASFQVAYAQKLPFPNATFDAVACTLALHHVAEDDRQTAIEEMYRVLKPGGRLLIAEFRGGHPHRGLRRLHRSTDENMIDKAMHLVTSAGFSDVRSGITSVRWLGKITARK